MLKIHKAGMKKNDEDLCGNERCGTLSYTAPEILMEMSKYSYKADLWSVGVIFYEILNGFKPFNGRTEYGLLESYKSGPKL